MGKKDFDNLFKVIQAGITLNVVSIISIELDLELPRGFIAKIYKVIFEWRSWGTDLVGLGAIEADLQMNCSLIRDPDDITTTQMPQNAVQHDVIAETSEGVFQNPTGSLAGFTSLLRKTIDFPEHIDVITARNMRFNATGGGADSANITESAARVEVYYTLEKVTDADILELLDIL